MNDASEDRFARLRWGVYAVLIAVAVGNMSGRLLAVNSVDKAQLESFRIKERLDRERAQLAEEGVTGEQLQERLAALEARLQNQLRLQRPFLSANDRSRWMTIRSLVEHGTYEIDRVVGEPTWDTIDMVQHIWRDGKAHLYSSKQSILGTILVGECWIMHTCVEAWFAGSTYDG